MLLCKVLLLITMQPFGSYLSVHHNSFRASPKHLKPENSACVLLFFIPAC